MSLLKRDWREIAKAIVTAVNLLGIVVSQGLLVGTAAKWVAVALAALTLFGVYQVPNRPTIPAGGDAAP